MSRIELRIYDLNTSAQTTEPQIPDKSYFPFSLIWDLWLGDLCTLI